MIGSMALREDGGAIVALVDGIHALDFADRRGDAASRCSIRPIRELQLADGKVDRRGRVRVRHQPPHR